MQLWQLLLTWPLQWRRNSFWPTERISSSLFSCQVWSWRIKTTKIIEWCRSFDCSEGCSIQYHCARWWRRRSCCPVNTQVLILMTSSFILSQRKHKKDPSMEHQGHNRKAWSTPATICPWVWHNIMSQWNRKAYQVQSKQYIPWIGKGFQFHLSLHTGCDRCRVNALVLWNTNWHKTVLWKGGFKSIPCKTTVLTTNFSSSLVPQPSHVPLSSRMERNSCRTSS